MKKNLTPFLYAIVLMAVSCASTSRYAYYYVNQCGRMYVEKRKLPKDTCQCKLPAGKYYPITK